MYDPFKMNVILNAAQALSILLFAWYGTSCFLSHKMALEFVRWQVPYARVATGIGQLAGSLGLLIGYFSRTLQITAAAALAFMMLVAVAIHLRIHDSLFQTAPALSLLALNSFICIAALRAGQRVSYGCQ